MAEEGMRAVMQGGPHDGEGYEVPDDQDWMLFPTINDVVVKADRYWRSIAMGTDAENIEYWIYEYEGRF
jgi:hypothetical protein